MLLLRPLVWFDNAATTQKPQAVIDRLAHFYEHEHANPHRAAHELAARATDAYEGARDAVAHFLAATSSADIVPWRRPAAERGALLRVIPVDDSGQILLDEYRGHPSDRTRLVAVTHVSNALGTIAPMRKIGEQAHAAGARVLIDGAQSVPHLRVEVQALDPDLSVCSGPRSSGRLGSEPSTASRTSSSRCPPGKGAAT